MIFLQTVGHMKKPIFGVRGSHLVYMTCQPLISIYHQIEADNCTRAALHINLPPFTREVFRKKLSTTPVDNSACA